MASRRRLWRGALFIRGDVDLGGCCTAAKKCIERRHLFIQDDCKRSRERFHMCICGGGRECVSVGGGYKTGGT